MSEKQHNPQQPETVAELPGRDEFLASFDEKRQALADNLQEVSSRSGVALNALEMFQKKNEQKQLEDEISQLQDSWESLGGAELDAARAEVDALNFKSDAEDRIQATKRLQAAQDAVYGNFVAEQTQPPISETAPVADEIVEPEVSPQPIDEIAEASQAILQITNVINNPNIDPEKRKTLRAAMEGIIHELDDIVAPTETDSNDGLDHQDDVTPLQNERGPEDDVEPLQNERTETEPSTDEEDVEPLQNEKGAWSKVMDGLRTARYKLLDRPGHWVMEKLANRNIINQKEGETQEEFEQRKERRGRVIVGLGYAATTGLLAYTIYKAYSGLSSGAEGALNSGSGHASMADFHRMQDTNVLPNIDHTTLDVPTYPTEAYVESGGTEIRETQQVLEQVLGHDVKIHDAERVYNTIGGDIFTNDSNYIGPSGDIRIGSEEGTYQFRNGFVEKAVEAYNKLSR